MKQLNNRGVALLTALMMTVIMLSIILGVMYLIDQTIRGSAKHKTYRNVVEASYGGADLVSRELIPQLFKNISTSVLRDSLSSIQAEIAGSDCLHKKLENSPASWSTSTKCDTAINPKVNTDMKFNLSGVNSQGYTIYSKIIDTTPGVPYSTGGSQLVGGGVTDSSAGSTLRLQHFVYRIEVTAERKDNPSERSNISVLYEY